MKEYIHSKGDVDDSGEYADMHLLKKFRSLAEKFIKSIPGDKSGGEVIRFQDSEDDDGDVDALNIKDAVFDPFIKFTNKLKYQKTIQDIHGTDINILTNLKNKPLFMPTGKKIFRDGRVSRSNSKRILSFLLYYTSCNIRTKR